MKNLEKQLQAEIVRWFSDNHPEQKGRLFAIFNELVSPRQAAVRKSLGHVSGVSDLVYIATSDIVFIELKAKGSRHNAQHIRRQIAWGDAILEETYHAHVFISSLDEFIGMIERDIDIENKLEERKIYLKNILASENPPKSIKF